jgi:hypothetical protein
VIEANTWSEMPQCALRCRNAAASHFGRAAVVRSLSHRATILHPHQRGGLCEMLVVDQTDSAPLDVKLNALGTSFRRRPETDSDGHNIRRISTNTSAGGRPGFL